MKASKLGELIPLAWRQTLPNQVLDLVVEENLNCQKCTASQLPASDPVWRSAESKCCSYWPFIPNFNVAKMIAANPVKTQAWLEQKRVFLPLGAMPETRLISRCPYLTKESNCSIWESRPARCATYFCQSSQGHHGKNFWEQFFEISNFMEQGLAQYWMVEAGFRFSEVESGRDYLIPHQGQTLTAQKYDELWAHHRGGELEYYQRAEEWRDQLSQSEIVKILGGEKWLQTQEKLVNLHQLTSWGEKPRPQL